MTTRAEIVSEARRWLRVPFHHQGRTHAGTDCGGLIGGVAVSLGILPADWWTTTFDPVFGGYGRMPAGGMLERVCGMFMSELDDPAEAVPGDVVMMHFGSDPQHLGIVADYIHGGLSLIHALSLPSAGAVVEHRLAPEWRRRVDVAYAYPLVTG